MNESTEGSEPLPSTSAKLLSGSSLLQIHVNASRNLPKDGSKEFSPTNTWMEKKQIQSALDERKELLEEERVEKWGCLAGAKWDHKKKLAEVIRRSGKHFQTLGFEKEGVLYLYPEEALYLLEVNSLELTFGGVPVSIQQGYSLLLGNSMGCSLNEYRTYSHLVRQGYRVLRFTNHQLHTKYERTIRLDQHTALKRCHPGQLQVKSEVTLEPEHSRVKTEECSSANNNSVNKCANKSLKQESEEDHSANDSECPPCGRSEDDGVPSQKEGDGSFHHLAHEINEMKTKYPDCKHEEESLEAEALDSVNTVDIRDESKQVHQDSELHQNRVRSNEDESASCDTKITREEAGLSKETEESLREPVACHKDGDSQGLVGGQNNSEENKLSDGDQRKACQQLETNNVMQTVSQDNQPSSSSQNVTDKAYDIAESLLSCVSNVLMEKEADSDNRQEIGTNKPKNLSVTLQSKIVKMLGTHFESGVSEEALNELASSAASTILSHLSPAKLDHESGTDPVNRQGDLAEYGVNYLKQADHKHSGDKSNVLAGSETNPAFPSKMKKSEPIPSYSISDSNDSDTTSPKSYPKSSSSSSSPAEDHTPESGHSSKQDELSQSKVNKRHAPSDREMDDCEPVMIKKAKMVGVCDSEIEIIDFVPEKKEVELVNLSDESSLDGMKDYERESNDGTSDDDIKSIEVIDVHDSTSDDSSNTSSDSSSGSDSSVILEEKHTRWDEERRRILDTFPNMHNLSEIYLEPPSEDLLPHNVQPQRRKYVISRWKLDKESRQIKAQDLQSQIHFQSQSQLPIRPLGNFRPQDIAHQLWQQNVPINPVAAVQAIAQLVLPMLGLSPTSCPPEQMWMPNNAWFPPRPSWNHGPRFNHHPQRGNRWQRFRPRPYGFRHHSSRYQRRGSNHYRSSHGYNQSNLKHRTDNPHRDEVIPIQSTSNTEIEESCGTENLKSTQKPSNWHSWMQQNKFQRRGEPKRLQKRGLTRGRYFNPPRKYTHMNALGGESSSLNSDKSSVLSKQNKNSNIKSESDSSGDESGGNNSNVQSSDQTSDSSSCEGSDNTQNSFNSSLETTPLLSPHDCTNFGAVFKSLQVITNVDTESLVSTVHESSLRPQFDLFLPTKPFKKGNLPVPDFHLCIVSHDGAVPGPGEIRALCDALNDSIPIMFAIVSPDSISFIQYCDVNLPSLAPQL